MAESDLSVTHTTISAEVGFFLGWTRTPANWTAAQVAQINAIIDRGLRRFYYPPPSAGGIHVWRFMRPVVKIQAWPTTVPTVTTISAYADPITTITISTGVFYPLMVGKNLVFTLTGNSYPIAGYTSSTVVTVTGDASAETDTDTVTITSTGDYDLPDDFGGIEGKITFDQDEAYRSLPIVGEGSIRALRQNNVSAREPDRAAIRPKAYAVSASEGQRFELMLWPVPDQVYNLTYRYNAIPNKISATNEYPLGGMIHGETILESCLAMAEHTMDDQQGIHAARFQELMAASIAFDRQAMTPEFFGYNGDNSEKYDRMGARDRRAYRVSFGDVTYNNVQY